MTWQRGEVIVRRELWRGVPWCAIPHVVVEDTPDLLVTYLPEQAPLAFLPSADGRPHPWAGQERWQGHGMLTLLRPDEAYSVMHFWEGHERRFAGWYLNLEEPYRRTATGYDTQDLELDIWIPVEGDWRLKDAEMVEQRVREGRFDNDQAQAIRKLGKELVEMLQRDDRWWDPTWATFVPDPDWRALDLPVGCEDEPVTAAPSPSSYRRRT